jgi:Recombination endonuclease VII
LKNVLCEHEKQKGHCRNCGAHHYCKHSKHRSHCRRCNPLGWAKGCLSVFKGTAKRRRYTPPNITPEKFVYLMQTTKLCAGCGGKLNWETNRPHLHHNHKTGEVLGFCHQMCNQAEGMLSKLTQEERKIFFKTFFFEDFN